MQVLSLVPMSGERVETDKKEEIDLHQTMDALEWAKEFTKVLNKNYSISVDEDWVHTWMANAIMCGWDHANSRRSKSWTYILKSGAGDIIKMFHHEPDESELNDAYGEYLNIPVKDAHASYNTSLYRMKSNYKESVVEVWNGLNKSPEKDSLYHWVNAH